MGKEEVLEDLGRSGRTQGGLRKVRGGPRGHREIHRVPKEFKYTQGWDRLGKISSQRGPEGEIRPREVQVLGGSRPKVVWTIGGLHRGGPNLWILTKVRSGPEVGKRWTEKERPAKLQ